MAGRWGKAPAPPSKIKASWSFPTLPLFFLKRVLWGRSLAPEPQPGEAEDGANSWRVSAANLKGRQNLFCPPEPQPGRAEDGANSWRVSAANLKGRQNLFCPPEPQPGRAEDGAQTHKGAFWETLACPYQTVPTPGEPVAAGARAPLEQPA
jgi:hypothetical protein